MKNMLHSTVIFFLLSVPFTSALIPDVPIDRYAIVSRFNPTRNASSTTTPMQVGNGNFAFGADVTGLQTFQPFAIMSSWGWKNDSFPPGKTLQDILDYHGVSWYNHDLLVQYEFDGEDDIQQWLISNPNRVNLGRTGLVFLSPEGTAQNVAESDLLERNQTLDLWSGELKSNFMFDGRSVSITTYCAQETDEIGVTIESSLIEENRLAFFLDFPWNDGTSKFEAPFVGVFNMTANHTTALRLGPNLPTGSQAEITHTLVNSTFITTVGGSDFVITRDAPESHRYTVRPSSKLGQNTFNLSISYSLSSPQSLSNVPTIQQSSIQAWTGYWGSSGFVDLVSNSTDRRAEELQRRIILSQYLLRVNEAGDYPPQESGLTNNGWYGKFHMEMFFWHCIHWALWNNWDLHNRSSPTYSRFLSTSITRAQIQQHWSSGARWSKMTDPTGRSAPGEINELLIWQQPHPLVFAEYEYRAFPNSDTLNKWRDVVIQTADWMSIFAWYNESSKFFDIGPPMYVVAEDTSPNVTRNPAFELAYWRFGLGLAEQWMDRLGEEIPQSWTTAKNNLAPMPIENGTYAVYEGIESNFWYDPTYINDHPALAGLYGWLPQTPGLNISMAKLTAEKVWTTWNISNCWGWDFPMLAMSAARNNDPEMAIEWLLHPLFQFDDVGMPIGGVRVPTPYFPGAGALLLAIAMMAEGWDGSIGNAPGFPAENWTTNVENLSKTL